MKRTLVIDDERIFPFTGDVVYARTYREAIGALSQGPWDEVWFDHDLGDDEGDGSAIVQWMYDKHRGGAGVPWGKQIGRAYVHTMNVATTDRMVGNIQDCNVPVLRVSLPLGTTVVES